MKFWVLIFLFIFLLAASAHAGVEISEIMYDLEGADAGREWVKIQNTSSTVDLTGWKFFENSVNHGLVLVQGAIILSQNSFAIIADNAEKFLLDWPGFEGTLFDSSFSLSNAGEALVLRDAGLADSDSITYSSDWGAAGDGNSLQKINNEWISALPMPGKESSGSVTTEETSNGNELEQISGSVSEPSPTTFSANAGGDKQVLAGAEVYFEGQIRGVEENMISKTRFLWNFGDGTVGEGRNIKHIFQYPGTYIVSLDASLGSFSDSDTAKINISPALVLVSEIKPGNFLEIKNDSSKISDISGFGIQINDSKIFSFLKNTALSASSFLTLDTLVLGFEVPDRGEVKILYPNGKILFSSKYESGILQENESVGFDGQTWLKGSATPGTKNSVQTKTKSSLKPISEKALSQPTDQAKITPKPSEENLASIVSSKNSNANQSLWSEIKWLTLGLIGGIFAGLVYLFVRHRTSFCAL